LKSQGTLQNTFTTITRLLVQATSATTSTQ
jgi:hypothetical protein